jgi:hypothetical protein
MAQENCPPSIETSLSDRAVLLHILAHVEELAGKLMELEARFLPNGQPDMLAVAQARRGIRKARRS